MDKTSRHCKWHVVDLERPKDLMKSNQGPGKLWARRGEMIRWNAMRMEANEYDEPKTWAGANGLKHKWIEPSQGNNMNEKLSEVHNTCN